MSDYYTPPYNFYDLDHQDPYDVQEHSRMVNMEPISFMALMDDALRVNPLLNLQVHPEGPTKQNVPPFPPERNLQPAGQLYPGPGAAVLEDPDDIYWPPTPPRPAAVQHHQTSLAAITNAAPASPIIQSAPAAATPTTPKTGKRKAAAKAGDDIDKRLRHSDAESVGKENDAETPGRGQPSKGAGARSKKKPTTTKGTKQASTTDKPESKNDKPTKSDTKVVKPEEYSDTVMAATRLWSDDDQDALFKFILGPESDDIFETFKKNRPYVFKKAFKQPKNRHSEGSIKSFWDRALKTFAWIEQVEKFTGGGGDADIDDLDEDQKLIHYTEKLEAVRGARQEVGSLQAKTIIKWQEKKWYDLFVSRYRGNPKISREVERHSGMALSDSSDEEKDPKDDGKEENSKVSEPRHTPARGFHVDASKSLTQISEYLQSKGMADKQRLGVLEQRIELDDKRLELDRERELRTAREAQARLNEEVKKNRFEMARSIVGMQTLANSQLDPQVADAANKFLLKQFAD
ncbi:unnamed protein product [Cyclocybe aegerita]|uniref:No apical meristem-associated C-terminal domain-containing protein n=1 Tax=Cyclocybe aegerita TaxID=1973307 RepID=A0A8S0WRP1_CYCAE|nr:unnamed protein product [Cyclocybe aegerita]